MRAYRGSIVNGECDVHVVEDGKEIHRLNPAYHLRNHSPDGYSWGYAGSGPAQLAIAILADHFRGDTRKLSSYYNDKASTSGELRACQLYHKFKTGVIQHFPMDKPFYLTSLRVQQWLDSLQHPLPSSGENSEQVR